MLKRPGLILPLFLVLACSDGGDPLGPPIQLSASDRQLVDASGGFGFDFYRRLAADEQKPNLFVSPLSVSMALGMALNGAATDTYSQMQSVLGLRELTEADINEGYKSVITQLVRRDRQVTVTLANSMWPDRNLNVQPQFTASLRNFFSAEVRPIDFSNSTAAAEAINKWAEAATRGRIKELFKELESNTRLVLVNAIYFKAPWTDAFKTTDTRNAAFTRADGSTVTVPMMNRSASYRMRSDAGLLAVEVPYANSAFSMVLLRPVSGPLSALEARLNSGWWNGLISSLINEQVSLRLPRFKIEYGKQLNDPLKTLGMPLAFDAGAADFSRITGSRGLWISRVEHKAFVEVNEQGTEAAAATGIAMVDSAPIEISFDRPFLFAIIERASGVLLFIGRVGDPLSTAS
ncbi:MAG: serpin family protein [Longimicrobiales bacterium]